MMRFVKHGVRFFLVTVGIIVFTSLTIDATDTFQGSNSALGILAKKATEGSCPENTVYIESAQGVFCIDRYEGSANEYCTFSSPTTALDSKSNLAKNRCNTESVAHKKPWTFVTFHQAKELCARRGMRLPNSEEWFEAALGTPVDAGCNTRGTLAETGTEESCVSARGIYDMVGNVWEWIDEEVVDGQYRGRTLPPEGYVHDADIAGVALDTGAEVNPLFDADYFWTAASGTYAMMRGGFYGSGSDAGIYAIQSKTSPSFSSLAIGFRCVVDLQ